MCFALRFREGLKQEVDERDMSKQFPWKRFWCRREASYTLGDSGFLFDPDVEHGAALNPNLTTLDQLQELSCLALLG